MIKPAIVTGLKISMLKKTSRGFYPVNKYSNLNVHVLN